MNWFLLSALYMAAMLVAYRLLLFRVPYPRLQAAYLWACMLVPLILPLVPPPGIGQILPGVAHLNITLPDVLVLASPATDSMGFIS